jgi:L-2-hydroxyglutarate oxidase LhgO
MKLYERGISNGTRLELLSDKDLPKFEPLAKTYKNFLWSPDTAVSDPELVNQKMFEYFQSLGGILQTSSVVSLESKQVVLVNGAPVSVGKIVNASGANAIHLAHSVGVGLDYAQLPVLGLYKITERNSLPLKTLVYPVPNPINPFLGVHFTLTVNGSVKIGPTAIPILGREQYSMHKVPDRLDLVESAKALTALATKSSTELFRLAKTELPKALTSVLIREGMKLVPSMDPKIVWNKKKPGIRAQLVNLNSGTFEMDFVVRESGRIVHVLNAVSPGWTSSIPFAKWIVSKYLI